MVVWCSSFDITLVILELYAIIPWISSFSGMWRYFLKELFIIIKGETVHLSSFNSEAHHTWYSFYSVNWEGLCGWSKDLVVKTAYFKILSSIIEVYWSLICWIWNCLGTVIPFFFHFSSLYVPRLYYHFVLKASHLFSNFTSPYRRRKCSSEWHAPEI